MVAGSTAGSYLWPGRSSAGAAGSSESRLMQYTVSGSWNRIAGPGPASRERATARTGTGFKSRERGEEDEVEDREGVSRLEPAADVQETLDGTFGRKKKQI